jgi:hypothetical protein
LLVRQAARRILEPRWNWPRARRNKWLSVALFAGILFMYELFDLWAPPWWTAWLIAAYFLTVLVVDGIFKRASICKFVCPMGGLVLFQPRKIGSMDCTFCLGSVHACPHDNAGILSRLPDGELLPDTLRSGIGYFSHRKDLAALALVVTFEALLNAFGMVSPEHPCNSTAMSSGKYASCCTVRKGAEKLFREWKQRQLVLGAGIFCFFSCRSWQLHSCGSKECRGDAAA